MSLKEHKSNNFGHTKKPTFLRFYVSTTQILVMDYGWVTEHILRVDIAILVIIRKNLWTSMPVHNFCIIRVREALNV